MKILVPFISICFSILFFNPVSGQEIVKVDLSKNHVALSHSPTFNNIPPRGETDPVKRYKKMKAGGIVLTAVGVAATAAGSLLIKKDNDLGKSDPNRKDASMNYGLGIGLIAVGASGVLSGVPLWIIDDRKLKREHRSVAIQASRVSAGLVYKFLYITLPNRKNTESAHLGFLNQKMLRLWAGVSGADGPLPEEFLRCLGATAIIV